jgi:F-type H+-transporting ATPase subunit delta
MSIVAIARRYAEALADVAIAHNQVEQMDAEVGAFAQMIRDSRELHDVFASPVVSQEQKRSVLDAIIERTGVSAMIANLLRTMLSHYRLHDLTEVHEQFRRAINRRRGIALAEVTTAAPASQDAQDMLTRKLQELVGKQVQVQFKTDPALIGGAVTRIESVVYDGSIRTQLQTVRQRLKEGTV